MACLAISICVASFGCAAFGETYTEWEQCQSNDAENLTVLLQPYGDGKVQTYFNVHEHTRRHVTTEKWAIPVRPQGGLIGTLSVSGQRGPLKLRLFYSLVLNKDLKNTGDLNKTIVWHKKSGLLGSHAVIRKEIFEETFLIPDSASNPIPLVLPIPTDLFLRTFSRNNIMMSCRCEITDINGCVMHRAVLVDVFVPSWSRGAERSAWVMNEPEADRLLREFVGIKQITTVEDLPAFVRPYSEIGAIWISEDSWERKPMDAALLKRLLLLGIHVYGRESTISSITDTLGLAGPQQVLMGRVDLANKPERSRNNWQCIADTKSLNAHNIYYSNTDKNKDLINITTFNLFENDCAAFMTWTLSLLGIYCLVLVVGLPVAFIRLKTSRRLHLWWVVPAFAAAVSVVGFAVGNIVLPRRARVDTVEYRFAYAGWPEVYCHTVARILSYEDKTIELSAPPNSFMVDGQQSYYDKTVVRFKAVHHGAEENVYSSSGMQRGTIVTHEMICFRQMESPFELTWQASQPYLRTRTTCKKVYVWYGGEFWLLGQLAAGESTAVLKAKKVCRVKGLPKRIEDIFLSRVQMSTSDVYSPMISSSDIASPKSGQMYDPLENNLVVLAVTDDEPQISVTSNSDTAAKSTIWIVQIPAVNPQAAQ